MLIHYQSRAGQAQIIRNNLLRPNPKRSVLLRQKWGLNMQLIGAYCQNPWPCSCKTAAREAEEIAERDRAPNLQAAKSGQPEPKPKTL